MGHLFGMNLQPEHYTPTNEVKSDRVKDTYSKQSKFALLETPKRAGTLIFICTSHRKHWVEQNLAISFATSLYKNLHIELDFGQKCENILCLISFSAGTNFPWAQSVLRETLNALVELYGDAKSQSRQHPKEGHKTANATTSLSRRARHTTKRCIVIPSISRDSPEVGGTTEFAMPLRAPWGIWDASAAMGFMKVPCAVAAAIKAACCCKPSHWKRDKTHCNNCHQNWKYSRILQFLFYNR